VPLIFLSNVSQSNSVEFVHLQTAFVLTSHSLGFVLNKFHSLYICFCKSTKFIAGDILMEGVYLVGAVHLSSKYDSFIYDSK